MQDRQKKMWVWSSSVILCAVAVGIIIYVMNSDVMEHNGGNPITADSIAVNHTLPSEDETPLEAEEEVNMIGMIETKDSKNLDIYMSASRSNNFGQLPFKQDESFKMVVTSEKVNELEIGLMSIANERIYSEIVKSGTGSVTIKVPESGMYRIYVNNLSPDSVQFQLKLGKAIEGPID
ncbi:hypothetical protein [Paenibacillus tundrae]|uniref:YtkA-like domain-containing protein n=1 Tax=Paenibacillus tundrae TaxID=528187 RepID=A0ABT9WBX4_9BACL|nr:hypothetical protein [Paenibacillus tundrae]MDQ0170630.1 hypothetical protein [Paenibacillus tundrae]